MLLTGLLPILINFASIYFNIKLLITLLLYLLSIVNRWYMAPINDPTHIRLIMITIHYTR